jgi:hypothetical protein
MVEKLTQFGITDGSVVLPNGTEHCGVRVSLVGDQIAQHLEHARDLTEERRRVSGGVIAVGDTAP